MKVSEHQIYFKDKAKEIQFAIGYLDEIKVEFIKDKNLIHFWHLKHARSDIIYMFVILNLDS